MAKAFKKTGTKVESIPTATTVEKVGDTEYGVADYQGRKTYFEKDDNGAYTIPSQDSELNPHFFPGYDKKSGSIDNSNATTKRDILTGRELRQVGKAFKAEQQFNKSLVEEGQYNIGDKEMLAADQDPNNPMNASVKTMAFTRDLSPKDAKDIKRIGRIVGGDVVFNQEEIDQNIGNMMRQNGWSYEQAYESVYGTKPTGPVAQKFLDIQSKRQEGLTAGDQQAQINALATRWAPFSGQTIDLVMNSGEATKQITTGTPVNQTVLPTGAAFGMVNGQRQLIMPSETPYNPALNRKAWAKMDTTKTAQEKWGGNPPLTFEAQKQYYRPNAETPASQPIITNPVFPATPIVQSNNQTPPPVTNSTSNQPNAETLPEDFSIYTNMDWVRAGYDPQQIFGDNLAIFSDRGYLSDTENKLVMAPLKGAAFGKLNPIDQAQNFLKNMRFSNPSGEKDPWYSLTPRDNAIKQTIDYVYKPALDYARENNLTSYDLPQEVKSMVETGIINDLKKDKDGNYIYSIKGKVYKYYPKTKTQTTVVQ